MSDKPVITHPASLTCWMVLDYSKPSQWAVHVCMDSAEADRVRDERQAADPDGDYASIPGVASTAAGVTPHRASDPEPWFEQAGATA